MRNYCYLFCFLLLVTSCKKSDSGSSGNPTPTPQLSSSTLSITLGAANGSKDSFNITSNISWNISITPSTATWLSVSTTTGSNNAKVYVSATQDNFSNTAKTATITLTPVGNNSVAGVNISVVQLFQNINSSILWQRSLGGSDQDQLYAATPTADGGYLFAGVTYSSNGDVTVQHGKGDVWLVKLDNSGSINWQKSLGGSNADQARSIIATSDGGYVLAGQTASNDGDVTNLHGTNPDMWVVKLNNLGNIVWQKTLGGTGDDIAYSIVASPDGGYTIVGRTLSNDGDAAGSHGSADVLVVKLNSNGDIVWKKAIGGSAQDVGFSIATTPQNSYIITGNTSSNDGDISGVHGSSDFLAVKLDGNGNIIWQKAFGGSSSEGGTSIISTNDGGYIIAGSSFSNDGDVSGNHGGIDGWLLKINSSGILQWQKSFGGIGTDVFNSVSFNAQGQLIVAGYSDSNSGDVIGNNGLTDFWTLLLDANGNILGKKSFGGTGDDQAGAIISTTDGNYITVGNTTSNNGDISGYHGGTFDGWVVKFKFL